MTIIVVLKNAKQIGISALDKDLNVETIEGIKEEISSVMNNDSNHIHFKGNTFDMDLIIMKDQIESIQFL